MDQAARGGASAGFYSTDDTFPILTMGAGTSGRVGQSASAAGMPMVETSNFDNVRKFPLQ